MPVPFQLFLRASVLQLLLDDREWSEAKIRRGLARKPEKGFIIVTIPLVPTGRDVLLEETLAELSDAGWLKSPRPGVYRITAAGRSIARTHPAMIAQKIVNEAKAGVIKLTLPIIDLPDMVRVAKYDAGAVFGKKIAMKPGYSGLSEAVFIPGGTGSGVKGKLPYLPGIGTGIGSGGTISVGKIMKSVDPLLLGRSRRAGFSASTPWPKPVWVKVVTTAGLEAPPAAAGDVPKKPPVEVEENPRLVPVWYGTHRRPVDMADANRGFANAESEHVYYGQCLVSVPKNHRFAGRKRALQWLTLGIGTGKFQVTHTDRMDENAFWTKLGEALAWKPQDRENAVLLFIHGYKNSFDDAAKRTAQLKVDLQMPHAAFYSWPSRNEVGNYLEDEAAARASKEKLAAFLTGLGRLANGRKVPLHVIAHSMGNLAFLDAVQEIRAGLKGGDFPFRLEQVIFAAPDVDQGEFPQLAKHLAGVCRRRTLYATNKDFPIKASSEIRNRPRAGKLPPPTLVDDVNTVDVGEADLHNLAHGYVADSQRVVLDMFTLLQSDTPPHRRGGVRWAPAPPKTYFEFY